MATVTTQLLRADDLLALGNRERFELVDGELIPMAPAGDVHGRCGMRLAVRVASFVETSRLGESYLAETGFLLRSSPDTVRAPDFAFVPASRVGPPKAGYVTAVPALVVEIVSPGDTASDMAEMVRQWLEFGVTSVWVVEPRTCTVTIHRDAPEIKQFRMGERLRDEAVLPGFELNLADVFSGLS